MGSMMQICSKSNPPFSRLAQHHAKPGSHSSCMAIEPCFGRDWRICRSNARIFCCSASKCWLVGSGPGPMELMTVKSLDLLEKADCVIYDDLACSDSLKRCRPGTELIYVGKRGQKASPKQSEVTDILVAQCSQHDTVVRLKGGCVSLFSRATEEIEALRRNGIPYELVPGVSSALAAPAAAGMPLTARGSSVVIASAHKPSSVNWDALQPPAVGTVVLLMGGRSFRQLISDAMESWSKETPVLVASAVGSEDQKIWRTTLQDAEADIGDADLSPCVVVVGASGLRDDS